jgi:flagellar motor protein MotB
LLGSGADGGIVEAVSTLWGRVAAGGMLDGAGRGGGTLAGAILGDGILAGGTGRGGGILAGGIRADTIVGATGWGGGSDFGNVGRGNVGCGGNVFCGGNVGLGGCIRSALRRGYVRTRTVCGPGRRGEVQSSPMKHQEEVEAAPVDFSRKRRKFSLRRLLTGVGLLAMATFVFGYYLPVVSASEILTDQVKTLASEYRVATEAFEKTSEQLSSAQQKGNRLEQNLNKIDEAESSRKKALEQLHRSIEEALKLHADRRLLKVQKRSDHVAIVIEALYLIYPHKTFVHAQGAAFLCQVARAIPKDTDRPIEIVAHANGLKPSSNILEKQFLKSWQLSGMMAGEVASELENCGITGTNLRAVGAAHFEGNPREAKKSAARFEVLIYPASG